MCWNEIPTPKLSLTGQTLLSPFSESGKRGWKLLLDTSGGGLPLWARYYIFTPSVSYNIIIYVPCKVMQPSQKLWPQFPDSLSPHIHSNYKILSKAVLMTCHYEETMGNKENKAAYCINNIFPESAKLLLFPITFLSRECVNSKSWFFTVLILSSFL